MAKKSRPPGKPRIVHPSKKDQIKPKDLLTVKDFPTLNLKQKQFLIAYSMMGVITYACAKVGISSPTFYSWKKNNEEFVKAFKLANKMAIDALETECRKRAMRGSDTLLIFLLKGKRPHIYRENQRIVMAGSLNHDVKAQAISAPVPLDNLPLELKKQILEYMRNSDGNAPVAEVIEHKEMEKQKEVED